MSERTRILIVAIGATMALALGLAVAAFVLTGDADPATIHIDSYPAYACAGEGCPE